MTAPRSFPFLSLLCLISISWVATASYSWKSKDRYYFPDLETKIKEIAMGSCASQFIVKPKGSLSVPLKENTFYISSMNIDDKLINWWRNMSPPMQMRVDPWLCDSPLTKKRPIFQNSGCQLPHYMHESAPRCQTKYLKWVCDQARIPIDDGISNNFFLPESNHLTSFLPPTPWILTARNSLVSMCGDVVSECGFIHSSANCMANGHRFQGNAFSKSCNIRNARESFVELNQSFSCSASAPWKSHVDFVDKVFVVAEVDDTYVYHIHLEIFPRIFYHLDFLLKNPDIKILIGCDFKKDSQRTLAGLQHGLQSLKPFMDLAGLSMDRLIVQQHVFAREIYFPMEGGCQDPVYNTWQILHMRNHFLSNLGFSMSHIHSSARDKEDHSSSRDVMLVLKRSSNSKHTRNNQDLVRQWSDSFTELLLSSLQDAFPTFEVRLFSDRNVSLMSCHGCQIREFANAKVLIGIHGAGLANMLYMKHNSAVVEFAPYGNDGRCLLGGGPFSRLATVMSHNYMIHHPPYDEYIWKKSEMASEFNITRFVTHIDSFLKSINFI